VPPAFTQGRLFVSLYVRTYSPPKVVMLMKTSDTEINPYRMFDCPLEPEAEVQEFFSYKVKIFISKPLRLLFSKDRHLEYLFYMKRSIRGIVTIESRVEIVTSLDM